MNLSVAITGGIGSGKTTVCKMLEAKGIPIFYSDLYVKHLFTDTSIQKLINENIGENIFDNGVFNKERMAYLIFNNDELRDKINSLLLPFVLTGFLQFNQKHDVPYVVLESAIIQDLGIHNMFSIIINVTADLETRIQRAMTRDNTTREKITDRIKCQKEFKSEHENVFNVYNENLDDLRIQIDDVHNKILKIKKSLY